jgi:glutathione S-transferase
VLTESRAIMQYLAGKAPQSELWPRDERERVDVVRWQFWDASHFSPQVGTLAFQKVFKPMFGMGEPDHAKVEEALVNFRRFAAVLDGHLQGKQYVVGERLTLADLTFASSLMYAQQAELPLAEFPQLKAWFERISSLEAWRQTTP